MSQVVDSLRMLRPGLEVRLAWVELVPPDLATALAALPAGRGVVLVPLLLSSGYHDKVDIPAAVRAVRPDAARAAVLGPDRLLATALADRLAEAGWQPGDAVVLAGAGSSDPDAVASVHQQATLLAAELAGRAGHHGRPRSDTTVTVGFGSSAGPDVPTSVAAARAAGAGRVAIAPYLLSAGFFATRLAAAGADLVAAPLGGHPAVAELALRRYDQGRDVRRE